MVPVEDGRTAVSERFRCSRAQHSTIPHTQTPRRPNDPPLMPQPAATSASAPRGGRPDPACGARPNADALKRRTAMPHAKEWHKAQRRPTSHARGGQPAPCSAAARGQRGRCVRLRQRTKGAAAQRSGTAPLHMPVRPLQHHQHCDRHRHRLCSTLHFSFTPCVTPGL